MVGAAKLGGGCQGWWGSAHTLRARSGPHSCFWGPYLASIAGLVLLVGAAAPGAAGARSVLSAPARGGAGAGREEGRGAGYVNDPSPVTGLRARTAGGGGPGRGGGGQVTRRQPRRQRLCRGDNVLGTPLLLLRLLGLGAPWPHSPSLAAARRAMWERLPSWPRPGLPCSARREV